MKLLSRILMFCLLFTIQAVSAVEVKGLFEAEVMTQSLSPEDKGRALKEALAIVINRVAAGDDLLENPAVKAALNTAEFYVQQVQYALETKKQGKKTARTMRVLFNEQALMTLIRDSNLAVWNEVRDDVLVWLVVEKFNSKSLLNVKEDFEVYSHLQAAAKKKGVPLMRPLMDLEDKSALAANDILSAYSGKVLNASRRYGVAAILSGAVTHNRHCWSSEWTLHFDGKVKQWSLPCEKLEQTLSVAMQGVYDQLSVFHAVKSDKTEHGKVILNIGGVNGMTAESMIKAYLKKLPQVQSVQWIKVEKGRHVFKLNFLGKQENLEKAIALQRILLKQSSTKNSLNYQLVSQ